MGPGHSSTPPTSNKETVERDLSDQISPNSWIIPRVRYRYRLPQENKQVDVPNVISIGPYHHRKRHLKDMEFIKESFFNGTVGEREETIRAAIRAEGERISKCYAKINDLSSKEFEDMVVFDGFFIVQLFRGFYPDDDLFQRQYIRTEIMYDLLLLENQLPFFVLVKLYGIVTQNENENDMKKEFTDIALRFYQPLIECQGDHHLTAGEEIKHLLSLIYNTTRWSPTSNVHHRSYDQTKRIWNPYLKSIRCATELESAGISFERRDKKREKCRTLDIEFKKNWRKSKLRIPTLIVDDNTERMLRNLILFEQLLPHSHPTYMFDYVKFLDLLINSGKDVQLLCYSGIIESRFGRDYEAVADIFNRLCNNAHGSNQFYYSGIFEQVNDHCDHSCNKQIANLHRNYFNSPWALLSFLAALLLLFLTTAQTLFALYTIDCRFCVVLFIVFGVLLVVIGLFFFLYLD